MDDWYSLIRIAWPLLGAIVLGALVRRALLSIARRTRASDQTSLQARVVNVIAVPAAVAVPLLLLSAAIAVLPVRAEWEAHLQHALGVGGLACLVWLAVRAIGAVERGVIARHPVDVENNLRARRVHTQARVFSRVAQALVVIIGGALVLMTFPAIRQIGATLLASAGIAGVVAGIAARPVFGNLIAGLQIAMAQPIRIDDVVIVQEQWGRVEEITSTYVVVRIWDERRMVVPLQWFIENPFQNWTRTSSQLLGDVTLWLDYRTPMPAVRAEFERLCRTDPRWDGRVCVAQVTDADRQAIAVRLLMSARNSGDLFDLRCAVRERMVDYLNAQHPEALPRVRASLSRGTEEDSDAERMQAAGRVEDAEARQATSPGPEDPPGDDTAGPSPMRAPEREPRAGPRH